MNEENCCGGGCGENFLQVGSPAPVFDCQSYVNGVFKHVSLKDYKGKWVVLFFYPRDFTFICPTEIRGFAKSESEFKNEGAEIIAASTDSEWSHKAWFEKDFPEVKFPILADTSHEVARDYNVLLEDGAALRGTFIVDPDGILKYMVISDLNVGRSVEETLRVLQALKTGEKCPIDWKPGDKTLGK